MGSWWSGRFFLLIQVEQSLNGIVKLLVEFGLLLRGLSLLGEGSLVGWGLHKFELNKNVLPL